MNRHDWWVVELRRTCVDPVTLSVPITVRDAIVAALEHIGMLEGSESDCMTFDEWADAMAVQPVLTIADVEDILEHPSPTVAIRLRRWLAEAQAKT